MQKENYEKAKTKQFEKYRAISLYTLLATQIKYDVTGIAVRGQADGLAHIPEKL